MKKLLASTFALAFIFTACSGSDDTANKEAAIKMAAESLEADAGFYSEEYAGCILEGMVDIAGVSWSDIKEAFERDGNLDSLGAQTSLSEAEEAELTAMAFTCMEEGDVLQYIMDATIDDMMDDARCEALTPECGWEWNEETQEWDDVWETQKP